MYECRRALSDHRPEYLVLLSDAAQVGEHVDFGESIGQSEVAIESDRLGNGLIDQFIKTLGIDRRQHLVDLKSVGADVSIVELHSWILVRVLEKEVSGERVEKRSGM